MTQNLGFRYRWPVRPALCWRLVLACALAIGAPARASAEETAKGGAAWAAFGGTPDFIKYSPLDQITPENVADLAVAWTFTTGDGGPGLVTQGSPLMVDGLLYVISPKLRVFALEPGTGRQVWVHDAVATVDGEAPAGPRYLRGLMHWQGRIFTSADGFLIALDAKSGALVPGFGQSGKVDLRAGLGRDPDTVFPFMTSPGVIYQDLIIVPTAVPEGYPSAPGHLRAYDARTGEQRWIFHTIPQPGERGHETWPAQAWKTRNGANAWSGASLDEARGLVFFAIGSANYDFYGGDRPGDNLFANSVVALDAATGAYRWHYQIIHHDLWDWDLPAPPTLVTITRNAEPVDAVAQITKSGFVFVLDRETGEPLFPVAEQPVPPSTVEGEAASPTQPIPLKPAPFARQVLTRDQLTRRTPEAHAAVSAAFDSFDQRGLFTPPSLQGHAILPGLNGGGQWGGGSFDPETGYFYVNANNTPWIVKLVRQNRPEDFKTIRDVYTAHCASCHGDDLAGNPPVYPALRGLAARYRKGALMRYIQNGTARMPGFGDVFDASTLQAVADYLLFGADVALDPGALKDNPYYLPYRLEAYKQFLDPDGYPAITPPWGELSAIDLNTGEYVWRHPFGEYPELKPTMGVTGSENYGGGIVTAGGLFFIGATAFDRKFRAFDKRTGDLLWETVLPASNNAIPAIYEWQGRHYVVVTAGGSRSGTGGDSFVAFALPGEGQ